MCRNMSKFNVPIAGQANDVLVDCTLPSQELVEDCEVCCQPMVLNVRVDENDVLDVQARRENGYRLVT